MHIFLCSAGRRLKTQCLRIAVLSGSIICVICCARPLISLCSMRTSFYYFHLHIHALLVLFRCGAMTTNCASSSVNGSGTCTRDVARLALLDRPASQAMDDEALAMYIVLRMVPRPRQFSFGYGTAVLLPSISLRCGDCSNDTCSDSGGAGGHYHGRDTCFLSIHA